MIRRIRRAYWLWCWRRGRVRAMLHNYIESTGCGDSQDGSVLVGVLSGVAIYAAAVLLWLAAAVVLPVLGVR